MEKSFKSATLEDFTKLLEHNKALANDVREEYLENYKKTFRDYFPDLIFKWGGEGKLKDVRVDFDNMDYKTKQEALYNIMTKKKLNIKYISSDMDELIDMIVDSYLMKVHRASYDTEELASFMMEHRIDDELYMDTDSWKVYRKRIETVDSLFD